MEILQALFMNFSNLSLDIQNDINSILPLLLSINPKAIILGGSYSTKEECKIFFQGKKYYLSDFDIFIISNSKLSPTENHRIYRSIISQSKTFRQDNPYFHIGLKFRTELELKQESQSIYYWELLKNGVNLNNSLVRLPQFSNTIFDDIGKPGSLKLNTYLYKCTLTRLWCNILFYPLRLIKQPNNLPLNLWYSYFISRGAMDWIMFKQLQNGLWKPSYSERFKLLNKDKNTMMGDYSLLKKLYNIRIGKETTHYLDIIDDAYDLAFKEINAYVSIIKPIESVELDFLINMSLSLLSLIKKNSPSHYLKQALNHCSRLTYSDLNHSSITSPIKLWEMMRREYSEFRFNRSQKDMFDHQINTEQVLSLGSYN